MLAWPKEICLFVTSDTEKMFFFGAVTLLYLFEVENIF